MTPPSADPDAAAWRGTVALAGRETRRVLSLWTQTLLPAVVTGLLFLAVFGGAFGTRLSVADHVSYARFLLPGLLVMTAASQAFANCATSLFQAKNEGYIDDLLTSPLSGRQLAVGYLAGGVLRGWLAAGLLAAAAWPTAGGASHPLYAVAALAITGLLFAGLGLITGLWADTFDQHAFVANLVVTPLTLVAGVFYRAEQLHEPWSTLTRLDPLFYLVATTRTGLVGLHEAPIASALALSTAASVGVLILAATLLDRGWRIKP